MKKLYDINVFSYFIHKNSCHILYIKKVFVSLFVEKWQNMNLIEKTISSADV